MTRQIKEIRNGRKHGPVNSFVNSTNVAELNPFVLWDHFYLSSVEGSAGFDFHGHSGVATISYPQIGDIGHEDTGGHSGLLKAGGIQIMAAGAGVLHKETVYPNQRLADAFQLWVALPEGGIEMGPVRYSTLQKQDIPVIEDDGSKTKVLIGQYQYQESTVQSPADMSYLHVQLEADSQWTHLSKASHSTAFIYVRNGTLNTGGVQLSAGELGIFEKKVSTIAVCALTQESEFLLISGAPLKQEIISNGASVHSNSTNLIAGAQKIRQLHINGIDQLLQKRGLF
ncbi:pirin family protein [Vibrio owensii]|uniref:pirin family protein n=1 Tax=Vibrio owensii TaxID=696485 RepID=UPI003DA17BF1